MSIRTPEPILSATARNLFFLVKSDNRLFATFSFICPFRPSRGLYGYVDIQIPHQFIISCPTDFD